MTKEFFTLSFLLVSFVSLNVSGQLRLTSSGKVHIGNHQTTTFNSGLNSPLNATEYNSLAKIPVDTMASMVILGPDTNNSGGYITFGDNRKVGIGEDWRTSDSNKLILFSYNGLNYVNAGTEIFSYSRTSDSSYFIFNKNLKVNGVTVTSDLRLKKDITPIFNNWDALDNINAISYSLKNPINTLDEKVSKNTKELENNDNQIRYGFIAQEIQKYYPELVYEDSDGYLSVDYIGFIPVLLEAVKDLRSTVSKQEEIISQFENNNAAPSKKNSSITEKTSDLICEVYQNRPNPFSNCTFIDCKLPENIVDASIHIYDLQGKQLLTKNISERGEVTVSIEGSTLSPGIYIYALIADGREIGTKRMILTD